jgi:hypothetical protein
MNDGAEDVRLSFERERLAADQRFREREIELRQAELEIKRRDQAQSRWRNPLVVAILAAAVAAAGNAIVASVNGSAQRVLEEGRAESARILEMIKTGDPEAAARNLQFLVDTGLIVDPDRLRKLTAFLETREAGSGPALPASGGGGIQFEQTKELTQSLKDALEADLKAYMAHLEEIGLAKDLPVVTIRIEPIMKSMGTMAYYQGGDQNVMVIDPDVASDVYVSRREATHHALMSSVAETCRSVGCSAIESGLADYFPASFANSAKLGSELTFSDLSAEVPFSAIKDDDFSMIYQSGQAWAAALWAIRTKVGKEAADRVAIAAWDHADWSAADPAAAFVAAMMAALAGDDASRKSVEEILRARRFPVGP